MLENKKLSYSLQLINRVDFPNHLINKWFQKNKLNSIKKKTLFMLNFIGYDISLALKNKIYFNKLSEAYSNHYKLYKNYYYNKKKIYDVIELHFLNLILTNNRK